MNNLSVLNSQALTMSSREIAELTGKQHKDVMRDIRNMLDEIQSAQKCADYKDARGRSQPMLLLNKEETLCLVAGYNVKLRMAIINRWQELESQQAPKLPQTFSEALQLAADQAKQIEQQTQAIEHQQKHITGLENLFHSGGTIPQFVKQLNGVNMNKVSAWLRENANWLYDSNAGKVYRSGQKSGYPKPHHWRCTAYARDKYLTERQVNINPQGLEPITKYEVTLLSDGKKWLYQKYIKGLLPMKASWDGEYTHKKDLA